MAEWEIREGDCLDVMATMEPNTIDTIITDPPYGLGFMGKTWDSPDKSFVERQAARENRFDHIGGNHNPTNPQDRTRTIAKENRRAAEWHQSWALAALRVAKPGAILLAFGGTRTWHRLACALEDSGWEIRDTLMWLYGQGFPKSHNLKGEWAGWGTALKPAWEPIIVAMKPLEGIFAENAERWGVAGFNVDGARIGIESGDGGNFRTNRGQSNGKMFGEGQSKRYVSEQNAAGRWPANLALDETAAELLDAASGEHVAGVAGMRNDSAPATLGRLGGYETTWGGYGDIGGASRFFYVAKASREEREAGLDRAAQVTYIDPRWANAVLDQALQAATGQSAPRAIVGSTIQCNDGSAWSMCWCGSLSTDPYHPVIRSITATATSSTITSATSKSSARQHTNGCMAVVFGAMARGGSHVVSAASSSPWVLATGISAERDGPSMGDADLATSVASWLISEPEKGGGHRVMGNHHPT